MSKKCKYPEIKAELKQRELESRCIRKQIDESSGLDRWGFWRDKRAFGFDTRSLLLAYAFLRRRPYRTVEVKTQPNSGPYPGLIRRCLTTRGHEITAEAIEQWLETSAPAAASEAA